MSATALSPSMPGGDLALQHDVTQFLFHEARLMDTHAYDAWLALWHPDGLYWVPVNDDDADPEHSVCIIYERLPAIHDRLARLKGKFAHAQSPRSKLIRVISNIVIEERSDAGMTVASTFALGERRPGTLTHRFGRSRHRLALAEGRMLILEKKVMLLENDEPMPNMTFLI